MSNTDPAIVNAQLNRLLTIFRPNTPTTDERYVAMVREYCDALKGLPPEALDNAVTWLLANRKERYWPLPAEIIEASRKVPFSGGAIAGVPKESFQEKLRKRDDQRRQDAHEIETGFHRDQAGLFKMAEAEGWLAVLSQTVREAARMIALRNELRRAGSLPSVPAKTHDGCELENIRTTEDGRDWIVIRQEDISTWRGWVGLRARDTAA